MAPVAVVYPPAVFFPAVHPGAALFFFPFFLFLTCLLRENIPAHLPARIRSGCVPGGGGSHPPGAAERQFQGGSAQNAPICGRFCFIGAVSSLRHTL